VLECCRRLHTGAAPTRPLRWPVAAPTWEGWWACKCVWGGASVCPGTAAADDARSAAAAGTQRLPAWAWVTPLQLDRSRLILAGWNCTALNSSTCQNRPEQSKHSRKLKAQAHQTVSLLARIRGLRQPLVLHPLRSACSQSHFGVTLGIVRFASAVPLACHFLNAGVLLHSTTSLGWSMLLGCSTSIKLRCCSFETGSFQSCPRAHWTSGKSACSI
jgi:hypothetical protein